MQQARRIAKLVRFRVSSEDGGNTLYFKMQVGRLGAFLDPEDVPEFEGEEAWFELERVPKSLGRPWSTWRVIRPVDAPP